MYMTEELWNDIPVLHVRKQETKNDAPVMFFLHGFQSAKEHNLHYAYHLANEGVRVVLPEAALHGVRSKDYSLEQMAAHFWEVVLTSIQEMNVLYEYVQQHFTPTRIGMSGTSMGGITTFGCLATYSWIDVGGSMMGSPAYDTLARGQLAHIKKKGIDLPVEREKVAQLLEMLQRYDLMQQVERLNQRPLFLWHGELDELVPFQLTAAFYEKIRLFYDDDKSLVFIRDEEAGHKVPRYAILAMTEWFSRQLTK